MTEETPNKNSPIRLPRRLRAELMREIGARMQEGATVTYGDLLIEAWDALRAKSDSKTHTTKGSFPAKPTGGTVSKHSNWISKLVEILDSGDREAASAVTQNIAVFHEFVTMKRRRHGEDHKVPAENSTQKGSEKPAKKSA